MKNVELHKYMMGEFKAIYTKLNELCVKSAKDRQKLDSHLEDHDKPLENHIQSHHRAWIYFGIGVTGINAIIMIIGLVMR